MGRKAGKAWVEKKERRGCRRRLGWRRRGGEAGEGLDGEEAGRGRQEKAWLRLRETRLDVVG